MTWTRRRYVFAGAAGLLSVLAITGAFLVTSGRVHEWTRGFALAQLRNAINGEVRIGALSGSLFGGVTLRDFEITQHGQPVVHVAEIHARYSLVRLIRGQIVLDDVRLVRPSVRLLKTSTGWNLATLAKPRPEAVNPSSWSVQLTRVSIDDGQVGIAMPERAPIRLEALHAEGRAAFGSAGTDVVLSGATFREAESGLVCTRLDVQIVLEGTRVAIRDLLVNTPGFTVRGSAAFDDGQPGALALTTELTSWRPDSLAPHVPEAVRSLPALTGSVNVSGERGTADLRWQLDAGAAGQTNGTARITQSSGPTLGLDGRVAVSRFDPAGWTERKDLAGHLTGTVDVSARLDPSRLDQASARLIVRTRDSRLTGWQAERLDADVRVQDATARVNGSVQAYGAAATVQTTLDLNAADLGSSLSASGTVSHLDLRRLPASMNLPEMASDLSGEYRVSLRGERLDATFTTDPSTIDTLTVGDDAVVQATKIGTKVEVSANAGLIRIPAELLRAPAGTVSDLEGTIRATASFNTSNPADLMTLSATAEAAVVEVDSASLTPARAEVSVAIDGGLARVARLDVQHPAASVAASGVLALAPGAGDGSDLQFRLDARDMSLLNAVGVPGLAGAVSVEGHVGGSSERWDVEGKVAGQQLAYKESAKALAVNGTVEATVPVGAWDQISANGNFAGTFIEAGGYEIPSAAFVANYSGRQLELQGDVAQRERSIEFDSSIDLYPDYRQLHLRQMTIAGPGEPWRFDGAEEAVIRYSPQEITINRLTLQRGAEALELRGRLAFTDEVEPSAFVALLSDVNLADLTTLALGTPRFAGTANGRVSVSGVLTNPALDADLRILDGRVVDVPFSSITLAAHLEEKVATVSASVVESNGATLDVAGEVPTDFERGQIDVTVKSTPISLGLVQAATTAVSDVHGTAVVDVRVTGSPREFDVTGTVMVRDGEFIVAPTGVPYRSVNADVRLADGWVAVESASLSDEDGHQLTMSGRTGWRAVNGSRAVELAVETNGLHVLRNDMGDVEMSGQLAIGGALDALTVTGSLTSSRARLELDEILRVLGSERGGAVEQSAPLQAAPPTAEAAPAATDPAPVVPAAAPPSPGVFAGATVDVAVRLPDNAVVRGRNLRTGTGSMGLGDLNMTLGGNLRVQKAPGGSPLVVGAVEVIRGFYEFQGRRFDVARGSEVRFRGGEPSNPGLDVTGERDVSGVTARVHITGTAQRPVLSLSSQPSLAESDVLALIVFNQPLSQLGASEQVDLVQRAGDIALGAIASSLTQSIGRSLDVDLFEIRAPSSGRAGEVAVGTQLSERVFVGFRQQFGAGDASRVSIEYRISEALRLLTSVGQGISTSSGARARDAEAAGLDLIYTIKY